MQAFAGGCISLTDLSEQPNRAKASRFLPAPFSAIHAYRSHLPAFGARPRKRRFSGVPGAVARLPLLSSGRDAMPSGAAVGDGLVPKRETGVADFVAKYPDCQGDNVVVAILDTGVDPGAAGLRRMPDGSPKVVDCIDCTGSGDVEMFDAPPVTQGSVLKGLSGRDLLLTPEIVALNPSGTYRVGLKAAYALCASQQTFQPPPVFCNTWRSSFRISPLFSSNPRAFCLFRTILLLASWKPSSLLFCIGLTLSYVFFYAHLPQCPDRLSIVSNGSEKLDSKKKIVQL